MGLDNTQHFVCRISLGDSSEVEEKIFALQGNRLLLQRDFELFPAGCFAGFLEEGGIREGFLSFGPSPELGESTEGRIKGPFGGLCDATCMGKDGSESAGDFDWLVNRPLAQTHQFAFWIIVAADQTDLISALEGCSDSSFTLPRVRRVNHDLRSCAHHWVLGRVDWRRSECLALHLPWGLDPFPEFGSEERVAAAGQEDEDNENPSGIPARAGYGSSHEAKTFEMVNGARFAFCVRPANDG